MQDKLKKYVHSGLTAGLWLLVLILLLMIKNAELPPFMDTEYAPKTNIDINLKYFGLCFVLVGAAVVYLPKTLKFLLLAVFLGYLFANYFTSFEKYDYRMSSYDYDEYEMYVPAGCDKQAKCLEKVNADTMLKKIKPYYETLPSEALGGNSYEKWLKIVQDYCHTQTAGKSELEYQKCFFDAAYKELIVLRNIEDRVK